MTNDARKTKLKALDESLDNILLTVLSVTETLKIQASQIQVNDYDSLNLFRGIKDLSQAMEKFIDLAPFMAFREDFEAVERAKEWLLTSTEFIGEKRQPIFEFLLSYQNALIQATGKATASPQYQLL